jgi:predicted nucleic acid-binding protein
VRFITEQLSITIVHADADITMEAARLKGAHAVAYADCFAAALAQRKKAKVVTGDPEFKKFGAAVTIAWIA